VVGFYPAEKDVAIDEVRRLCHLAGPHRSSPAKSSQCANLAVSRTLPPSHQAFDEIPQDSPGPETKQSSERFLKELFGYLFHW
jgi:hypothetical protein